MENVKIVLNYELLNYCTKIIDCLISANLTRLESDWHQQNTFTCLWNLKEATFLEMRPYF